MLQSPSIEHVSLLEVETSVRLQGVQTSGLQFRLVDAKEQVVGRLAAQLANILQVHISVQDFQSMNVQSSGMLAHVLAFLQS